MVTIIGSGRNAEVFLNSKEYSAFEIMSLGKNLNLPPRDLLKSFKEEGISNKDIRAGLTAYNYQKQGASIFNSEYMGRIS